MESDQQRTIRACRASSCDRVLHHYRHDPACLHVAVGRTVRGREPTSIHTASTRWPAMSLMGPQPWLPPYI